MGYEIKVSVKDSQMKAVVSSVQLGSAIWAPADITMPITDEKMANVYLASLLEKFKGKVTLGTGLPSPYKNAIVQFDEAYLKLSPVGFAEE